MSENDRRRAERSDVTGLEYLASLERPSILNLLLVNANGDLYQIADKFNVLARRCFFGIECIFTRTSMETVLLNLEMTTITRRKVRTEGSDVSVNPADEEASGRITAPLLSNCCLTEKMWSSGTPPGMTSR